LKLNRTAIDPQEHPQEIAPVPLAPLGRIISQTRFIVLIAVLAVMLVAVSLFLLGSWQAIIGLRGAWGAAISGDMSTKSLTVSFLETVTIMLKAVVFYLIGVGLYSLFIAPLNITVAMGIESLTDLESKVISVIVVILATTFLEHFILWEEPLQTLQFAGSLALVVVSLVLFEHMTHRTGRNSDGDKPAAQDKARHEMFHTEHEHQEVQEDETAK
jgi:uncharacterized membrane protein YqhA